MPAARSSSSGRSGGSGGSGRGKRGGGATRSKRTGTRKTAARSADAGARSSPDTATRSNPSLINPLDLVLISRERIQQTLDEAAERGRVTRGDANELVLELVKRGRALPDDVLREIERLLERGRGQIGTASKRVRATEPVDRLVRGADRARRTVGVGPSFPVLGYDELTAGQVEQRLVGLKPAELRRVRDYEQRHANRKTVLDAVERALA